MKYRFLIEHSGDKLSPFSLATVKPDGETSSRLGDYGSLDEAKAKAQTMAQSGDEDTWGERAELLWKDPPQAWQPDAIVVSQYLTEMYPDLPT